MATTSERDDLADDTEAAWNERPIFGTSTGLPWWGAILLGFGLAIFGAAVDLQLNDQPTRLFQGAYFAGCLAAVCWVRRRNLFAPMVQPPLILATILPLIVVYGSGMPQNFELKDAVLTYGLPVINGFPTMAITTGVTFLLGIYRLFRERDPDNSAARDVDEDYAGRPVKRRRGVIVDHPDGTGAAAAPARSVRPSASQARPRPAATGDRPAASGRQTPPVRRPIDPAAGRRARADDKRARPLEDDPRAQPPRRRPGTERQVPPTAQPGQRPVPGRRRAPSEPLRRPQDAAQPPLRQPGEPLPPPRPPRRQPPPPRPRPWDPDDRG